MVLSPGYKQIGVGVYGKEEGELTRIVVLERFQKPSAKRTAAYIQDYAQLIMTVYLAGKIGENKDALINDEFLLPNIKNIEKIYHVASGKAEKRLMEIAVCEFGLEELADQRFVEANIGYLPSVLIPNINPIGYDEYMKILEVYSSLDNNEHLIEIVNSRLTNHGDVPISFRNRSEEEQQLLNFLCRNSFGVKDIEELEDCQSEEILKKITKHVAGSYY